MQLRCQSLLFLVCLNLHIKACSQLIKGFDFEIKVFLVPGYHFLISSSCVYHYEQKGYHARAVMDRILFPLGIIYLIPENLFKPKKRVMTKKEMKELTNK